MAFFQQLKWMHDKVILIAQDKTFKGISSALPVYFIQLGLFINVNNGWKANPVFSPMYYNKVKPK